MTKLYSGRAPISKRRRRSRRSMTAAYGPREMGRSAATAHGCAHWMPTAEYVSGCLHTIEQASEHLRLLAPHCAQPHDCRLISVLLDETAAFLAEAMPPELPFLSSTHGTPRRLRIAVVSREWLLTAPPPRSGEHLREFLRGYQEIIPFSFEETCLLPIGLRLAVAEKCRRLPSPGNASHLELLPRLNHGLARTCRFIGRTDWGKLVEEISPTGRGAGLDTVKIVSCTTG